MRSRLFPEKTNKADEPPAGIIKKKRDHLFLKEITICAH